jgi:gentisate 1,2-dioxygenase
MGNQALWKNRTLRSSIPFRFESVVNIENKVLHLFNPDLEEKYFDETELEEALQFIAPGEQ